ncbi:HD domain-containing protein, partial [Enterobacter roggenkampii]|uniref:HD domain-containing protein n=1 Tax=Enterobacter roggenkampii TaxID=1812935 RepID=UPI0021D23A0C
MRSLPHGLASRVLIDRWLIDAGLRPRQATGLAAIVDAHHGIRSAPELRADAAAALENYPEIWRHAQRELIESMAGQTDVRPVLSRLGRKVTGDAQQLLTGLVVIADWLASNSEQFPLTQVDDDAERLRAGLDIDLTSPWQAAPLLM